jgi:cobalt/nickel transport system permease protein
MHHAAPTTSTGLRRIDPRLKLLSALALVAMVLTASTIAFPLAVAALFLMVSRAAGVPGKRLALRLAEPLLVAAMVAFLKLLFTGTTPLFHLNLLGLELTGHREGLQEGLQIASRILGAVSVVSALTFTTDFTELMGALSWLRIPRGLTETTMFAWRWLFLLHDDARVVYAAQRNRLGYAGYRRGLRSFGTLAGALVIKAFDGSQAMTTAMVQRGYDGDMPLLKQRPFRRRECAASLLVILCFGIAWRL